MNIEAKKITINKELAQQLRDVLDKIAVFYGENHRRDDQIQHISRILKSFSVGEVELVHNNGEINPFYGTLSGAIAILIHDLVADVEDLDIAGKFDAESTKYNTAIASKSFLKDLISHELIPLFGEGVTYYAIAVALGMNEAETRAEEWRHENKNGDTSTEIDVDESGEMPPLANITGNVINFIRDQNIEAILYKALEVYSDFKHDIDCLNKGDMPRRSNKSLSRDAKELYTFYAPILSIMGYQWKALEIMDAAQCFLLRGEPGLAVAKIEQHLAGDAWKIFAEQFKNLGITSHRNKTTASIFAKHAQYPGQSTPDSFGCKILDETLTTSNMAIKVCDVIEQLTNINGLQIGHTRNNEPAIEITWGNRDDAEKILGDIDVIASYHGWEVVHEKGSNSNVTHYLVVGKNKIKLEVAQAKGAGYEAVHFNVLAPTFYATFNGTSPEQFVDKLKKEYDDDSANYHIYCATQENLDQLKPLLSKYNLNLNLVVSKQQNLPQIDDWQQIGGELQLTTPEKELEHKIGFPSHLAYKFLAHLGLRDIVRKIANSLQSDIKQILNEDELERYNEALQFSAVLREIYERGKALLGISQHWLDNQLSELILAQEGSISAAYKFLSKLFDKQYVAQVLDAAESLPGFKTVRTGSSFALQEA